LRQVCGECRNESMIVLVLLLAVLLVATAVGLLVAAGAKGLLKALGSGVLLLVLALFVDAVINQEASCRECEITLAGEEVTLTSVFAVVAFGVWVVGCLLGFLLRATGRLLGRHHQVTG
jgi:hypothetical protein